MLDPENPVVKLCVAGMAAEAANRLDDARTLFEQAWEARQDDLDACIAAHYLARHQDTLERILHWNQEALRYADLITDTATDTEMGERIAAFYPSLYLNLGKSYEDLGDHATARHFYHLAQQAAMSPAAQANHDEYSRTVRRGIRAGLQRTLHTE